MVLSTKVNTQHIVFCICFSVLDPELAVVCFVLCFVCTSVHDQIQVIIFIIQFLFNTIYQCHVFEQFDDTLQLASLPDCAETLREWQTLKNE